MPGTLLITGSNGFIGSHLLRMFLEQGWKVTALVHRVPEKKIPGVIYHESDLAAATIPPVAGTADAFIHCAYVKQEKNTDAFSANVNGTKKLLEFAGALHIPVKIFISSLSATEHALSGYGRQKYELEKLFLADGGTVIRAGLVLGDGGLFGSMKNYLQRRSIVPLFGDGRQPVQTVFIDDLANVVVKVANEKITGRYVIAEDRPVPYREFYAELCASLGVKPKFIRCSYGLAAFLVTLAGFAGMQLPVTKDNLSGLKQMARVPSAADLEKLGVNIRTWKESLAILKK
ncbi:MAG TPA: NAD(P)-dependent oxidoreductase [Bacteroidia bacterium]|nr:NAD(P)-dependent oxidoreductase [Bacteroidia bacterium]